jgi:putative ABC transport system substrate-binding protein
LLCVAANDLSLLPLAPHRSPGPCSAQKPAEIPIGQPTKFEVVINLKTAKALALTISPLMRMRADEMIE